MRGTSNNHIVGKCSRCGGVVSVPIVFMSVNRPVPQCESCGAVADQTSNLPTIRTVGGNRPKESGDRA